MSQIVSGSGRQWFTELAAAGEAGAVLGSAAPAARSWERPAAVVAISGEGAATVGLPGLSRGEEMLDEAGRLLEKLNAKVGISEVAACVYVSQAGKQFSWQLTRAQCSAVGGVYLGVAD